MTARLLSWAATAAAFGILLQPYAGSSATSREGQPWQSVEEETLGLEGQDHGERTRCMRDKQPQPHGLLKSHLGKRFPSELRVDDLFSRGPLKGAACELYGGCGILTLKPQPQEGKPCVREVPKLVHFIWLDHALPKKYAANIARFMEVNSDWPVMLWVNGAAKDVSTLTNILGSKRFLPDPEAAIKRLHLKSIDAYKSRFRNWDIIRNQSNVGARSDWIRLEVVYWYGGVYMDTDVHPRHGFSEYGGVFRWPFVSYSSPEGYGNLCNCVWSAEKQSPFLKMNFEGWREAYFNYSVSSGVPIGCGVMTAAFVTYNHPEIIMLGQEYIFMPTDGVEPVMTMSFDGSWIEKGMWGRESQLIVDDKNETADGGKSDGSACSSSSQCSSGTCRGSNCCGTKGKSAGCNDCNSGGTCAKCDSAYFLSSSQCYSRAPAPALAPAPPACECSCHGFEYVPDERNNPVNNCWMLDLGYDKPCCTPDPAPGPAHLKPDGSSCSSSDDCRSGSCRGGNCCKIKGISGGCNGCNSNGDCSQCDSGYFISSNQCYSTPSLVSTTTELAAPARAGARTALPAAQPQDGHHTLMILLRTGGKDSAMRRESIKKTWASGLADNQLKIMGGNEGCRQKWGDNHWKGLTCLEANAHTEIMHRTDFSWLLVVDDDTYVVIDRLTNLLDTLDPHRLQAFGAPDCGNCGRGRKGFCGGGGYFLSRQSLLHMAGIPRKDFFHPNIGPSVSQAFVDHFMKEPDNDWCDVRFACVAQDKGLRLVSQDGMYGNAIEDGKLLSQIIRLKKEKPPLVFHSVRNASYMERIHRLVVEMAAQRPNSMKKFVEPLWPKNTSECDSTHLRCCSFNVQYGMVPHQTWGSTPEDEQTWHIANDCDTVMGGVALSNCPCGLPSINAINTAPTLVDKEEDEEDNPFMDEVADQESAIYEAMYKKKAASTGDELGASVVAGLLKESGANTSVLRRVWNAAKKAPDVPHGAKGKMNFKEFVVACKLTVKAGGSFAASSGA